jgi:hypothetical protein
VCVCVCVCVRACVYVHSCVCVVHVCYVRQAHLLADVHPAKALEEIQQRGVQALPTHLSTPECAVTLCVCVCVCVCLDLMPGIVRV